MGLTLENGRCIPLFRLLTKQIQYGKENILSVRLENKESSRWYPGAEFTEMRLAKTAPVWWGI
jgi:hypothetical protein